MLVSGLNDPVKNHLMNTISNEEGKLGVAAALSLSGAAAGVIRRYTIHTCLNLIINKQLKSGEHPLPALTESSQGKLWECCHTVKLLIIDEVYPQVELLSSIDERLRRIFQNNFPFEGFVVIVVGDPKQIVPVVGKPICSLTRYFDVDETSFKINKTGSKCLSLREEKAYIIYALCSEYNSYPDEKFCTAT